MDRSTILFAGIVLLTVSQQFARAIPLQPVRFSNETSSNFTLTADPPVTLEEGRIANLANDFSDAISEPVQPALPASSPIPAPPPVSAQLAQPAQSVQPAQPVRPAQAVQIVRPVQPIQPVRPARPEQPKFPISAVSRPQRPAVIVPPAAQPIQNTTSVVQYTPIVIPVEQHAGTPKNETQYGPDWIEVEIYNSKSQYIDLVFATAWQAPEPYVEGDATGLNPQERLSVFLPPGYEGMIALEHAEGSKIESSYVRTGGWMPHVDVSYVDGFTHAITCTCGKEVVTGCNIDLWDAGQEQGCPQLSADGKVCLNPARPLDYGPAHAFFAPCQGAAYTFPHDDDADRGCPDASKISCCVGTDCEAPERQLM